MHGAEAGKRKQLHDGNTHPIDKLVGDNLRRLRREASLTQMQLAEQAGVSYQQIQKYEKATDRMSASMLWQCAVILKVPVQAFFMRVDDIPAAAHEQTSRRKRAAGRRAT